MNKSGFAPRFGGRLEQLEDREVPNSVPIPFFNTYQMNEDTAVEGFLDGSDLDPEDQGNLVFTVVDQPLNGAVVFQANGRSFTYTPRANYNNTAAAPDRLNFRITDGKDISDIASITFLVAAVNDVPTLAPATFTLPENAANGQVVGTVVGADVDNDPLTYSIVSGNSNNAFAINPTTGVVTVFNTLALNFETTPTITFMVEARDTGGLAVQAPVTVNLTDVVESIAVGIDVRPGERTNVINPRSRGKVQVAILSSSTFDARTVDINSLRFGRTGNENSLSRRWDGRPRFEYRDVNRDGKLDVVVKFETRLLGFQSGDTTGILTGKTLGGISLSGMDSVRIRTWC